MALVEPLKYKKSGGSAIALNEFEVGDQIPGEYVILPKGYIDGLFLEWVSGTSIRVTSGDAYIPSLTQVVELPAALTKTLSGAASTWYHVYLFVSGGVADVEIVTTSPAAPYSGRARSKSGDNSRRYLGAIRTNAGGSIIRFESRNGQTLYMEEVTRPLNGGTSSTATPVSLAALVPPVSFVAVASMNNTGTAAVRYRPTGAGFSSTNTTRMYGLPAGTTIVGPLPTDASQQIDYQADSGGVATLDVLGFLLER